MWKNHGNYYELNSSQLSDVSIEVRYTAGLTTSSSFGEIKKNLYYIHPNTYQPLYHQNSIWCQPSKLNLLYKNYIPKSQYMPIDEISEGKLIALANKINVKEKLVFDINSYGIQTENECRSWYSSQFLPVKQVGILVPTWDTQIGASPDGLVGDNGCVEFKAPLKMYKTILDYLRYTKIPEDPDKISSYKHIIPSHFDQMQGGMAVTGRSWCDYVLFCKPENTVFIQRIPFLPKYWFHHLYPCIRYFIDNYVDKSINFNYFKNISFL